MSLANNFDIVYGPTAKQIRIVTEHGDVAIMDDGDLHFLPGGEEPSKLAKYVVEYMVGCDVRQDRILMRATQCARRKLSQMRRFLDQRCWDLDTTVFKTVHKWIVSPASDLRGESHHSIHRSSKQRTCFSWRPGNLM